MGRRKLPYEEGDWIAVPLRQDKGYALGLLIAHDKGGGLIVNFYGERFLSKPSARDAGGIDASAVMKAIRCGDLGLTRGEWSIIGSLENFSPEHWPLPKFGRIDISNRAFRVSYGREDLMRPISEELISKAEMEVLPEDGLYGAGAVERLLTHLLS